jgi:hypothetical protein
VAGTSYGAGGSHSHAVVWSLAITTKTTVTSSANPAAERYPVTFTATVGPASARRSASPITARRCLAASPCPRRGPAPPAPSPTGPPGRIASWPPTPGPAGSTRPLRPP